jgi:hypothetical protein
MTDEADNTGKTDGKEKGAQPERRRHAPTRLSAELPSLTKMAFRNTLGGRGFAEAGLITEWAAIVGADVARMSQPIHLGFPRGERRGGVLTIQCGGAAALELQHLKPQILERINSHFGYTAIAELRFRQGSVTPRSKTAKSKTAGRQPDSRKLTEADRAAVAEALRHVPDGEIKASLERLGLGIRRRGSGR